MTKIKFYNNTVFNTEQNGNNYIVDSKPNFPVDLTDIIIESENNIQIIHNGQIVECYALDNRYWFTIIEKPANVIVEEQMEQYRADIDYIAMETGVDI